MPLSPDVLPGAAAEPLRAVLTGPTRPAAVVGVHRTSCYVRVAGDSDVMAVETADGLGLPCAVRLAATSGDGLFARVRLGDPAQVGGGRLVLGRVSVRVTRWWAPRLPKTLPTSSLAAEEDRATMLADVLRDRPAPVPWDGAPLALLGAGPGLTPAGDDVLAGLLVGLYRDPQRRAALAADVLPAARSRTTALSATLLRCAARGHAVPALLDVDDLLAGHGPASDLPPAVDRLVAVGHSSGTALAWGLLRAWSSPHLRHRHYSRPFPDPHPLPVDHVQEKSRECVA